MWFSSQVHIRKGSIHFLEKYSRFCGSIDACPKTQESPSLKPFGLEKTKQKQTATTTNKGNIKQVHIKVVLRWSICNDTTLREKSYYCNPVSDDFLRYLQFFNALHVFESDSKTCSKCNMPANSCEKHALQIGVANQVAQCNPTFTKLPTHPRLESCEAGNAQNIYSAVLTIATQGVWMWKRFRVERGAKEQSSACVTIWRTPHDTRDLPARKFSSESRGKTWVWSARLAALSRTETYFLLCGVVQMNSVRFGEESFVTWAGMSHWSFFGAARKPFGNSGAPRQWPSSPYLGRMCKADRTPTEDELQPTTKRMICMVEKPPTIHEFRPTVDKLLPRNHHLCAKPGREY